MVLFEDLITPTFDPPFEDFESVIDNISPDVNLTEYLWTEPEPAKWELENRSPSIPMETRVKIEPIHQANTTSVQRTLKLPSTEKAELATKRELLKERRAKTKRKARKDQLPLGQDKLKHFEEQLNQLDPDAKESKKQRRLIRNRMSAQLHRERKKAYVDQLEAKVAERDAEITHLKQALEQLQNENRALRTKVQGPSQDDFSMPDVPEFKSKGFTIPESPDFVTDAEPDLDLSSRSSSCSEDCMLSTCSEYEALLWNKNIAVIVAVVLSIFCFSHGPSAFSKFTMPNRLLNMSNVAVSVRDINADEARSWTKYEDSAQSTERPPKRSRGASATSTKTVKASTNLPTQFPSIRKGTSAKVEALSDKEHVYSPAPLLEALTQSSGASLDLVPTNMDKADLNLSSEYLKFLFPLRVDENYLEITCRQALLG